MLIMLLCDSCYKYCVINERQLPECKEKRIQTFRTEYMTTIVKPGNWEAKRGKFVVVSSFER